MVICLELGFVVMGIVYMCWVFGAQNSVTLITASYSCSVGSFSLKKIPKDIGFSAIWVFFRNVYSSLVKELTN